MYFFHREDIRRALFVHRGCGVAEKKMFLVLPLSRCFGWQDWKRERGRGPGHKGTSLKRGAASRNTNFRPPSRSRTPQKDVRFRTQTQVLQVSIPLRRKEILLSNWKSWTETSVRKWIKLFQSKKKFWVRKTKLLTKMFVGKLFLNFSKII